METTTTELPESRVKIEATVPATELEHQLRHAAGHFAAEMKIPGFRQGKVPPQLVLQRVGREAVLEEAVRHGLPDWYEEALLDSGVIPVGDPSLDVSDTPAEGEPLTFTIEVGVRPTASAGDYQGLEVGRAAVEVPAEKIDETLTRIREQGAKLIPVERAAADGDRVLIDYSGSIDGEQFEGGQGTDQLLELGAGTTIEGFETAIVGAEPGDERSFDVTFPEDYGAEHLAGKAATFEVTVKEVREQQLPDLDDDFAAENSEFDTLAELRADIESKLAAGAEQRAEGAYREAAVDAAVAAATVTVPDELINARAEEIWHRVEHSLQHRGIDPEMFLQYQGRTREEAIADAREEAEQGLSRESVLAAIAEAEAIEVSEEEMIEALTPPDGQKGENPKKALKRLRETGRDGLLVDEIRIRKAADLVIEAAKPVEMDAAEAHAQLWEPDSEGADALL